MKTVDARFYTGHNSYAANAVAFRQFELEPAELESLAAHAEHLLRGLGRELAATGVVADAAAFPAPPPGGDARVLFAHCYASTALLLQRFAGHRVAYAGWRLEDAGQRAVALFEFEALEVGERAAELALLLLCYCWNALDRDIAAPEDATPLAQHVISFARLAVPLALPRDTQAIIDAARRADIPCLKMDRFPFEPRLGSFRIRPNGLLKLGHCCHQHIVDGTFCVDRSNAFAPLLRDREQILSLLHGLGLPVPRRDPETGNCSTLGRAQRCAARIGYPVVLRPLVRERGDAPAAVIRNDDELRRAYEHWRGRGRRVMLEALVEGDTYRIVAANRKPIAVLRIVAGASAERHVVTVRTHPSLLAAVARVAAAVDAGLLALTLVSRDIGMPLPESDAAFLDLELAPELDALLPDASPLLAAAADAFLAWLFPPGSRSRVPLIAVTGTNGKTTTSRMVAAVLMQAGHATGLACTDGVYVGGTLVASGDSAGIGGHERLLEHPRIDAAVLETARGAVLTRGIAYDRCDVALCLNVTPDHLGDRGVDSLEQMADLKRQVVERAREGAVLNADDPLCQAMAPFLGARRLGLVSMRRSARELAGACERADCFAVLESIDGAEWMVIHDAGRRIPVAAVAEIPATFDGLVRYNVANALHAGVACHLAGVDIAVIRRALGDFPMSCETTPGRLNFFEGLPYRLLLDLAHNPDGVARLCEFVDRLPVAGRRILVFSAPGHNTVPVIAGNARSAAGHFDHYVCFNYQRNVNNGHDHVPWLLADTLRECGVAGECIDIRELEMDAFESIFRLARPGDFVVFLCGVGNRAAIWERIRAVTQACRGGTTALQEPSFTSSLQ